MPTSATAMGDGIERAIARAGELETLVANEVAALERAYSDNEDLALLSDTPMDRLPPQAQERIGIQPGQVNLLVRLVLRHPTRTLTDQEANLLRDEVYARLHEGTVQQWAS